MAPSRGLLSVLRTRRKRQLAVRHRSIVSSNLASLAEAVTNPSNKHQTYRSRIRDPYLNLSIEHYMLQNSPPDSTILFLYSNRPSVIIGRNQNPWVEVNLPLLEQDPRSINLVRRRSGGGTVFHDEGNVNYSVICPTADFHRDKHAEMVVRALRSLGVDQARVNARHDIVVDCPNSSSEDPTPFKVSGSAYKLTRLRSLHHGTCLLNSPNIGTIGRFLKSPLKNAITARGVESVSSPIMNVNVSNSDFEEAVIEEFNKLYDASAVTHDITSLDEAEELSTLTITKGYDELRSLEWIYGQTPQFTYSSPEAGIEFTARNASVTEADVKTGDTVTKEELTRKLIGQKIYGNEVNPYLQMLLSANPSEQAN